MNPLKKLMKDESGITALETAIILIAFVVVAAVSNAVIPLSSFIIFFRGFISILLF